MGWFWADGNAAAAAPAVPPSHKDLAASGATPPVCHRRLQALPSSSAWVSPTASIDDKF